MQRIHFLLTRGPSRLDLPLARGRAPGGAALGSRRPFPLYPLAALLLGACAARAPAPPPPPPASAESADLAARPPPPPPPPARSERIMIATVTNDKNSPYVGVIDREGLHAIIDQGLGRLLGKLKIGPVLQRGKFEGFRVTGLDPVWSGAGILLDDVIVRLNGQPIERPEQAQVAFESLRVASEISLDLTREGKPKKLRYRIESRVNNK
jgi:hypothetical protein